MRADKRLPSREEDPVSVPDSIPEATLPGDVPGLERVIESGKKAYLMGYRDGWKAGWKVGLSQQQKLNKAASRKSRPPRRRGSEASR